MIGLWGHYSLLGNGKLDLDRGSLSLRVCFCPWIHPSLSASWVPWLQQLLLRYAHLSCLPDLVPVSYRLKNMSQSKHFLLLSCECGKERDQDKYLGTSQDINILGYYLSKSVLWSTRSYLSINTYKLILCFIYHCTIWSNMAIFWEYKFVGIFQTLAYFKYLWTCFFISME